MVTLTLDASDEHKDKQTSYLEAIRFFFTSFPYSSLKKVIALLLVIINSLLYLSVQQYRSNENRAVIIFSNI